MKSPRPTKSVAAVTTRPHFPVWWSAGLLALVTIAVYWPDTNHDFVNYDDPHYVTSNVHVQSGLTWANLKWAFGHPVVGNWHPLTMLSHMLDCQIYGLNPWGHHLTNVLLHGANTALVFLLLRGLTGAIWQSLMVAAFFGLHPLHVESVAWVAERKDVLSTFFGLLCLMAYAKHVASDKWQVTRTAGILSRAIHHVSHFYFLALFFFACGLMSKPMLVTLPFVLLLLDYWPLNRIGHSEFSIRNFTGLVLEKTPFFALAAVMCVVTYWVQQHTGMMHSLENVPLGARLENALISYCRYLGKLFWPTDLAVFYPYPDHWPTFQVLLAGGLMAGISAFVFVQRARHPYMLTGRLWFCGTLVPVIGLVQVGGQSMADRYTYIPSLGILIPVVWGAYDLAKRWRYHQMALGGVGCAAIVLCTDLTRQQLGYWQNNETLYRHALAVTKDNYLAHHNLGIALYKEGQVGEAISQYREALRLKPDYAEAHYNLGAALAANGQTDEAIRQFQTAIQLKPDYAEAHVNLGTALGKEGRLDEAIGQYREAVRLQPDNAEFHYDLGTVLGMKGRIDEAIVQFQEALRLKPDFAAARYNLAHALQIKNAATGR
ncbi:MAG: tetratricopeptide repeat protein [Limisphaerales bacterium]